MARPKDQKYSLAEKLQKLQEAGLNEPPADKTETLRPLADRIRDMLNIVQSEPAKATDMTYLIMYDITSDKVRTQIAKYLERQGCIRIQKSVFIARSESRNFQEICDTLNEVNSYYDNEDSILLVPVNTSDVRSMKVIGKALQIDIITDKPNTLFF